MQIGRFFSLGQGRVGQYWSPRVLVVRLPFQPPDSAHPSFCCLGFHHLRQAQTFARTLASQGIIGHLRRGQLIPGYAYEVILANHPDLAHTLAQSDQLHPHQQQAIAA